MRAAHDAAAAKVQQANKEALIKASRERREALKSGVRQNVQKIGSAAAPAKAPLPPFAEMVAGFYAEAGGKYGTSIPTKHSKLQRAYVCGIMPPFAASVFSDVLNRSDAVAFVQGGPIPVTCGHSNSADTMDGLAPSGWVPSCTRLFTNETMKLRPIEIEQIPSEITEAWLPYKTLVEVNCFDPVWGRDAGGANGLHAKIIHALEITDAIICAADPDEARARIDKILAAKESGAVESAAAPATATAPATAASAK